MCVAHTGHAGNSGIQNHSCGEFFPVRSYCIGSADYQVAEFCGVRRDSHDSASHAYHLDLLKRAERITDVIFAARAKGDGCSVWINRDDQPEYGWIVGSAGHESIFDCDGPNYPAVYADVVGKLEFLDDAGVGSDSTALPVCIGSWISSGQLYVDISACHDDFDEAFAWGKANDQLAIYSLHEGIDYPL